MSNINLTARVPREYSAAQFTEILRDVEKQVNFETISFTPVFGSLTVVGETTYSGRLKVIGGLCFFQVSFLAATSIASVAGTDYLTLPMTAVGISGTAQMTNTTTNVAVGNCHIDVSTSRCYLPTQTASGNTFLLSGWFEVAA